MSDRLRNGLQATIRAVRHRGMHGPVVDGAHQVSERELQGEVRLMNAIYGVLGCVAALLLTGAARAEGIVACTEPPSSNKTDAEKNREVTVVSGAADRVEGGGPDVLNSELKSLQAISPPSRANQCVQAHVLARLGRTQEIGENCRTDCSAKIRKAIDDAVAEAARPKVDPNTKPPEVPPEVPVERKHPERITPPPPPPPPPPAKTDAAFFGVIAGGDYAPIAPAGGAGRLGVSFRLAEPFYLDAGALVALHSAGPWLSAFYGFRLGGVRFGPELGVDVMAPTGDADPELVSDPSAALGLRLSAKLLWPVHQAFAPFVAAGIEGYPVKAEEYAPALFLLSGGVRWGLI
jgi:hypothetical protein